MSAQSTHSLVEAKSIRAGTRESDGSARHKLAEVSLGSTYGRRAHWDGAPQRHAVGPLEFFFYDWKHVEVLDSTVVVVVLLPAQDVVVVEVLGSTVVIVCAAPHTIVVVDVLGSTE